MYKIRSGKANSPVMNDISRSACIVSPLETLRHIEDFIQQKKTGLYMRFGDGDVYLSLGKNDSYQSNRRLLRNEMIECFSMKGPGIIKSLSIHSQKYGCEKEMFPGNHLASDKAASELLGQVYPFFVGYQIFSPVALHYAAAYYPVKANEFLKLLKQQALLFIGNENTPAEIVSKLFGKVRHIKAPEKNSFDNIDEIEKESAKELDKERKYGVVIISMGCSGRVLMKRLHKKNYNIFFFDFGSLLDGICGKETRTWLKVTNINYEALLKEL